MNGPCREMTDRIADYVLGALDPAQREALTQHLKECPGCRAHAEALRQQSDALMVLGDQVQEDMASRTERAIGAFEAAAPGWSLRGHGWVRMAVAALLVLGIGIGIGRLTAPKPVDVEQLRADLEASVTASLKPMVVETVAAETDRQLVSALPASETRLKTEIVESIRTDLRAFATDMASNSEQMIDERFSSLLRLIEAARVKDRQRVVQAFEQVELNRRRDRTEIGRGLQSLVNLTSASPAPVND